MHRSCVELFRLVVWTQVCGISRGHLAGRPSLQDDKGLVTSILSAAIRVAAVGADVAAEAATLRL